MKSMAVLNQDVDAKVRSVVNDLRLPASICGRSGAPETRALEED
jgi:hypothetical protein